MLHEWVLVQKEYIKKTREAKNAEVWLIRLTLLIQRLVHSLWITRNEALHQKEDSAANKKRHEELNGHIDEIYRTLPRNRRVLPASDRAFFLKEHNVSEHTDFGKRNPGLTKRNEFETPFLTGWMLNLKGFLIILTVPFKYLFLLTSH